MAVCHEVGQTIRLPSSALRAAGRGGFRSAAGRRARHPGRPVPPYGLTHNLEQVRGLPTRRAWPRAAPRGTGYGGVSPLRPLVRQPLPLRIQQAPRHQVHPPVVDPLGFPGPRLRA